MVRCLLTIPALCLLACAAPASAQRQIDNVAAFARLYGVARWFYPSDAAAALDWNRFAVEGVRPPPGTNMEPHYRHAVPTVTSASGDPARVPLWLGRSETPCSSPANMRAVGALERSTVQSRRVSRSEAGAAPHFWSLVFVTMTDLPMADFRGRVLLSRERVKFAEADPYGHLASGAYVNMIMSHRVEVLDDLLGFSIMRSAGSGVAFPARNIEVSYLRPAFVGEMLEVGSWLEELGTSSFEVRAMVVGFNDRAIRALARMHFVTVDGRSGKAVPVPATLPSSLSYSPLLEQPHLSTYLGTVTGLPERWSSAHAAR